VVLGGFSAPQVPFPVSDLKTREQTLIGSQGHPGTFAPVIDLIATRRLCPSALVSHVVGLDELPAMFELLDTKSDGVVKVVVEPWRAPVTPAR
jgi:threonine dehydrogenase-like Zn-dependent dehydrogenase